MKIKVLLLILPLLASCSTAKYYTSNVAATEVKDVVLLNPESNISLVGKDNKCTYNDSLTTISEELVKDAILSNKDKIPVTKTVAVNDKIINQMYSMVSKAVKSNKKIWTVTIPESIDSLIESTGSRFGMIVISTGFTRVKGNYGNELAKGIGLGILTLGAYYQVPVKSYLNLYVLIADSKDNNITFFRKSSIEDKSPVDELVVDKQVLDIFKDYTWTEAK